MVSLVRKKLIPPPRARKTFHVPARVRVTIDLTFYLCAQLCKLREPRARKIYFTEIEELRGLLNHCVINPTLRTSHSADGLKIIEITELTEITVLTENNS